MTPTETTAFLRRYNAWRRGEDETQPMPDPREVGLAIDAAVEIIERLDRIESAAQNLVKVRGRYHTEIAYRRLVVTLEESK